MKRFIIVMLSALMLFSFSSASVHQAENKHSSFADDVDSLEELTIRDSLKMSGWDYVDAFNIDRNNLQECLENEKAP